MQSQSELILALRPVIAFLENSKLLDVDYLRKWAHVKAVLPLLERLLKETSASI